METIDVGIEFNENSLRGIGRRYETEVIMTDYQDRFDVYTGPLNNTCFEMIKFYLSNHWLDGCIWVRQVSPLRNGETKLVIEAEDQSGEEQFNITVIYREKINLAQKRIGSWETFFWGLLAGLFPTKKALEIIRVGFLFNYFKKKRY